ncbi:hypothetical protein Clacol_010152 [Clathrus columnatus]|uniref:DUF6533 domain-containing protein n=1 Tax=Clathrus columnatus TaxID=1419009 RepID=A0AAV5ARV0_9AGAM|nr:hypothetical protein Clacol_010152 [Clathrus columnatus]
MAATGITLCRIISPRSLLKTLPTTTALLVYDTILTIPDAVKYLYNRKFTMISWFYVLAQYGTLCGVALNWAVFTNTLTDWVPQLLAIKNSLNHYISRAYVVAPRNHLVNGILGCLLLVDLGVGLTLIRWWKCDTPRGTSFITISKAIRSSAIGQIAILLFDIGVASTLLYYTWNLVRRQHSEEGCSTPFTVLFFQQAWSLGDVLSYKLARPSATGADTSLEIVLSPILLGRFLFQLRKSAEKTDNLANSGDSLESHQLTTFRVAENLSHGNTLPLAFATSRDLSNHTYSSVTIAG